MKGSSCISHVTLIEYNANRHGRYGVELLIGVSGLRMIKLGLMLFMPGCFLTDVLKKKFNGIRETFERFE